MFLCLHAVLMLGFTDTTAQETISMEITSSTNDSPRLQTWKSLNLSLSQINTSFPNENLSSVNTDSVLTSKTPEEIGFVNTNEVALYSESSTAEENVSSTFTDGVSKLNEGSHTILPQYFTDDNLYVNNNSHEQFDLSTSNGKEILSTYQEKDTSNDTLNIPKETYTPEYDIESVTTEEPNLYENLTSSKLSSGMKLSSTLKVTSVENTDLNQTLSVGLTNSKEALEVLQSTLQPFTDLQAEFSQDVNYHSLISTQTFTDLSTSATVLEQTQSENSITSDFSTTLDQTKSVFETSNTSFISLTETETNDIKDLYVSTPITGQTGDLLGTDDQQKEGTWSYDGYTSDGMTYASFV